MATKRTKSEAELIEKYRITFENAVTQPEIVTALKDFTYDAKKMAAGKKLFDETQATFDFKEQENDETKASRIDFDEKLGQMLIRYRRDRKKAKVALRKDAASYALLKLTQSVPSSYVQQVKAIKEFYDKLTADKTLQGKLAIVRITAADIKAGVDSVVAVQGAREHYLKEVGESQNATKAKDEKLEILEDWMTDFYGVAEIALEDQPQLLESLGVFVRS